MTSFPPNLYVRTLTVDDLDQCINLENRGFPESERASPEKLKYRLTVCPELCFGLFAKESNSSNEQTSETKDSLIGHVISTKTYSSTITDASMDVASVDDPTAGHCKDSRYIGLHGLVIDPNWQNKRLGRLLMQEYIQRMSDQKLGDQIIIIAHKGLVPFYEKLGFKNLGESECQHANEQWFDLAVDLV